MSYKKIKIFSAILAGGKAKRFGGFPKGNCEIRSSTTIVEHLINEIKQVGIFEVAIIANESHNYQKYNCRILSDNFSDCGPIAGIESALSHFKKNADAVLFMPCDLPCITSHEIETLKEAYFLSQSIVFAEAQGVVHPLCAIINVNLLEPITKLILQGEKKIMNFWQALAAKAVVFNNHQAFVNINSFSDLKNFGDRTTL
jgi:molybdenum cofactor guanylyltransferase